MVKAFLSAVGNYHLQLRLYKRLGLPNNLQVLAKLAQNYFLSVNKIKDLPKFDVQFNPAALNSVFLPGAVFVSNVAPTPELLDYFFNHYFTEKITKESKDLLKLFRPMVSQISSQFFAENMLNNLKRLCIRSSSMLPVIKDIFALFECDLSNVIADIVFPTLLEYLYKPDDSANALDLIKVLISKSKHLTSFIKQLVSIRNVNESQFICILQIISITPNTEHSQEVIEYVISLSQRIKSESAKGVIAKSISHLISEVNLPSEFLLANATNPYFANIVCLYDLKSNFNYNQSTPIVLISLLSIKIPDPLPAKVVQFITEPVSPLFNLSNLTEDENLALTRVVINSLKVYPTNIHLIKRFSKSVVSNYSKVRKYSLKNWPDTNLSLILSHIKELITEETNFNNFMSEFHKICSISTEKFSKPDDINSFICLITQPEVISNKRIKYILSKYSSKLNGFSNEIFKTSPYATGFALCMKNFSEKLEFLLPDLNYEKITSSIKTTRQYIKQVLDDPNFDEIGKFKQLCRELVLSAQMPIENIEPVSVFKALDII